MNELLRIFLVGLNTFTREVSQRKFTVGSYLSLFLSSKFAIILLINMNKTSSNKLRVRCGIDINDV